MGLFKQNVAIDLGTSTVMVCVGHKGVVLKEPSIVAVKTNTRNIVAIGEDARQMIGEVPMERGGFGKHSWVEINLSGGTYVFDPDYTSETGKSGFLLTYEQGDTWVYMNYEPML